MVSIVNNVSIVNDGNRVLKWIENNPYEISFTDKIVNPIKDVVHISYSEVSTKYLYNVLSNAKEACSDIESILNSEGKVRTRIGVTLKRLKAHIVQELDAINIKSVEDKLKNETIELLNQLNDAKSVQSNTNNLLRELEKNTINRIERLVDETDNSFRNRMNEGNDNIRSILQSARNDFEKYVNHSEERLKNLISETNRKNQIFNTEITDLFQKLEKESANRIEVRIQRAENTVSALSKLESETEEKIKDVISSELKGLDHFISNTQETINSSIRKTASESTQKIQTAQTDAQTGFDEHVNKNIEAINDRINEKINDYDKLKEQLEHKFNEKISVLEGQISIVTSGVMADQHIKQANTERMVYWVFQIMGFLFMIAAIYSGSVFFSELTNIRLPFMPKPDLVIHVDGAYNNGANPSVLMFMRLSMIILLTAPAIYLLKEAAVHRHKENIYRQRGIQLATISPYLDELEKEERAAIKKELVPAFFQFHDGKADTQNVPDFLRDVKEAAHIAKIVNGQPTKSRRFGKTRNLE
ncbi:hypothetical protein KW469_02995 [Vibrio fluvialis]|nr:hypothetical protein [Vibrio fluvialis]